MLNGRKAAQRCAEAKQGLALGAEDCSDSERARYYGRISKPLLDRIDILVEVPAVTFRDIISKTEGETSASIRVRMEAARKRQLERFADNRGRRIYTNSQMGPRQVKKYCPVEAESLKLLEMAVTKLGLSARAFDRVLKVARTVADLAGEEAIRALHVSEAVQYRMSG
jgi:magnesium chelatase family protein